MTQADLILRNASLPESPDSPRDVVVRDGRILMITANHAGTAVREIDATGCIVAPGFIDAHVHLNEPGRADWEGFQTGTHALVAGGTTTFFDMPLNSSPPVLNAVELERKRTVARAKSRIDFALWGGLVPGNADQIPGMAKHGAIGIKAFLCDSGLSDFPETDTETLREAAKICAQVGIVLALHAESPAELRRVAEALGSAGGTSWRDYAATRPESVEVAAVQSALEVAAETGCRLHIVHVSAPAAVDLIHEARGRGVDATCETCPHYLLLDESAMETRGALAKCAPPLRPPATRERLWQLLAQGRIHTIGSDHSPAPPDAKTGSDFFKIWGGISGCQHSMTLFWQAALERGFGVSHLAELTSTATARRFGIPNKGRIAVGADADIVLLRPTEPRPIRESDLFTRHRISPYIGRLATLEVHTVLLRGRVAFQSGTDSGPTAGLEVAHAFSNTP